MTKVQNIDENSNTSFYYCEENRFNFPITTLTVTQTKELTKITFKDLLTQIREPSSEQRATHLKHLHVTDLTAYNALKLKSQCFIIGDLSYPNDKSILEYVPCLVFDIDGYTTTEQMQAHFELLKSNDLVFCAFPSVSGLGLRIFIWSDNIEGTHKQAYKEILNLLSDFLSVDNKKSNAVHLDSVTANISRKFFYGFVPDELIYLNEHSTVFKFVAPIEQPKPLILNDATPTVSESEIIRLCENKTRKSIEPLNGSRNGFIHSLACNLNEHGLNEEVILNHCAEYAEADFNETEIKKSVQSALKRTPNGKYTEAQIKAYKRNGEAQTAISETMMSEYFTDEEEEKKEVAKIIKIENFLNKRYHLRYNIIANDVEIAAIGTDNFKVANEDQLISELYRAGFKGFKDPFLSLLKSDFPTKYNPLLNYFEQNNKKYNWKPSDPDFIELLANHVNAKDALFFKTQFKKMLVRVVACAISEIPFNKQCFTFVGKQNDGKTSFIRSLCPPDLKDYIKENLDIDKDGRLALCQNLIINLDELASLNKSDINQIKTYFTLETVKDRPPYGKKPITFKRTASFFASTNNNEILTDETGNVRWLVFEINGFDFSYSQKVDINAIWAQAYNLLKSGFEFQMTADEIVHSEVNNKQFKKSYAEFEILQKVFIASEKGAKNAVFLTGTEIREELEFGTTRKLNHVGIGKALRELGILQTSEYNPNCKKSIRGYYVAKIA